MNAYEAISKLEVHDIVLLRKALNLPELQSSASTTFKRSEARVTELNSPCERDFENGSITSLNELRMEIR